MAVYVSETLATVRPMVIKDPRYISTTEIQLNDLPEKTVAASEGPTVDATEIDVSQDRGGCRRGNTPALITVLINSN